MIAKPSIAFNDFSGTAKEVTARNVNGRNVLSVRAKQSKVFTPSQMVSRNSLSRISRAYKQLTDSQMAAWESLASRMRGISIFGDAASMTAHNAFVRLNSNRALVGKSVMQDAPEFKSDIPQIYLEDFWVTPFVICFAGIASPRQNERLMVKMSAGQSTGISNGWSKTIIVANGVEEDWGEANITRFYTKAIGYTPRLGEKLFLELWWMDIESGFVGESIKISAICKDESQVEGEIYTPRNQLTVDNLDMIPRGAVINKYTLETAEGSALMIADIDFINNSTSSGMTGELKSIPANFQPGRVYMPARCKRSSPWSVGLWECYTEYSQYSKPWQVAHRGGTYDKDNEIFGIAGMSIA